MEDVIHFKLSKIDADISKIDTDISALDAQKNDLLEKRKFLEQLKKYGEVYSVDIPVHDGKMQVNGSVIDKPAPEEMSMNTRIINIVDGVEKTTKQVVQEYADAVGKQYAEVSRAVSKAIHALHKREKLKIRPITEENPKAGSYIIKA